MPLGIGQPSAIALPYFRFQRNYLWDVLLPDVGVSLGGLGGFAVAQLVQSVDFGDYSIEEPTTMRFGPYEANFAGLFKADGITMTFLKTMPDIVAMYFNAWKKLILSSSGLYYHKNNYARPILLRFMDSTGATLGQYKFNGCFPVTFPEYRLSYKNDEVTTISIDFEFDTVEYTVM